MFPLDVRIQTKFEDVLILVRLGYGLESCMKLLNIPSIYQTALEYELSFDDEPEAGFTRVGWLFEKEARQKSYRRLMLQIIEGEIEESPEVIDYAVGQLKRMDEYERKHYARENSKKSSEEAVGIGESVEAGD